MRGEHSSIVGCRRFFQLRRVMCCALALSASAVNAGTIVPDQLAGIDTKSIGYEYPRSHFDTSNRESEGSDKMTPEQWRARWQLAFNDQHAKDDGETYFTLFANTSSNSHGNTWDEYVADQGDDPYEQQFEPHDYEALDEFFSDGDDGLGFDCTGTKRDHSQANPIISLDYGQASGDEKIVISNGDGQPIFESSFSTGMPLGSGGSGPPVGGPAEETIKKITQGGGGGPDGPGPGDEPDDDDPYIPITVTPPTTPSDPPGNNPQNPTAQIPSPTALPMGVFGLSLLLSRRRRSKA